MTPATKRAELRRRILRCVPLAGSGDAVGPLEVAERLGLDTSADTMGTYFQRLCRRGLVVRLRPGAYQLAPTSPRGTKPEDAP